ncbi:DUF2313 domain-containing protein, partial [Escherichia coli]|nr:DUF2313 domain-containing protein [Escherichia coli]
MDVTNDDYIHLLSALLPPGPAWSASDPAIAGAAPSLTRVHQRADALMRELDPRTTTELINRWERLCGLPDECIPAGTQTLRQRQQRLDAKVNLAGGINEDFYLAQLAALGGTVAKLAMRQPFVLFKGLTFQKLCLPGAFRPGDHHNK